MLVSMCTAARRIAALVFCAVALVGCGGGGGGGGGNSGADRGAFTLSGTTVSFTAKRLGPLPAEVTLQMRLTGTGIATAGAAYRQGVTPASWLSVDMSGSGANYVVTFRANTTQVAAGTYTTTISVGTADAAGNVLKYQDVQVSYSLADGVSVVSAPVSVEATLGHADAGFDKNISVVSPANMRWSLSADVPWIAVPATVQQGSSTVPFTIDTSALGVGTSTATVTVTNATDSTDRATVPVTVTVTAPSMTVNAASPLLFGGPTGLMMEPLSARFALGTGSRAHPWSVAFTPTTGGNWLQIPATTGTVNDSGTEVILTPLPTGLGAGVYTGEVTLTANVNGTPVSRSLPVSLNVDAQRIWASAGGVGLSSFPSRQTLTRRLRVFNSQNRTDVQLQVSSDESWLQASLPDQSSVLLTATQGALAPDQVHFANVTISSTDPLITNQAVVRVGVWRGSSDPVDVEIVTPTGMDLAANPVEPLLYAVGGVTPDIQVRNVYTGALIRTLSNVGIGPMVVSSDGRIVYVLDRSSNRIIGVDSSTGAVVSSYQTATPISGRPVSLAYARPDGHPILISGLTGEVFDVATGTRAEQLISSQGNVIASKDGRSLYIQPTLSIPAALVMSEIRYSSLNSLGFSELRSIVHRGDSVYSPGNGTDIALTEDDSAIYRASRSPYGFGVADAKTLVAHSFLPAGNDPAAVQCGWRGYCYGMAYAGSVGQEVWFYDSNHQNVGGVSLNSSAPYLRGLKLSADDTRLVVGYAPTYNTFRIGLFNTPQ